MKHALPTLAAGGLAWAVACGGGDGDQGRAAKPPRPVAPTTPRPVERGSLSGRLTDQATSLGLGNVTVLAQTAIGRTVLGSAVSQADGSYTLAGLPVGKDLRVVCQPVTGAVVYETRVSEPVTGAVVYETRVSEPVTLKKGVDPGRVDLAFAAVPLASVLEVARPEPGPVAEGEGGLSVQRLITLPHRVVYWAVVRTAPPGPGKVRFEGLEPGQVNVDFAWRSTPTPLVPDATSHRRFNLGKSFRVEAGATAHTAFEAPPRQLPPPCMGTSPW